MIDIPEDELIQKYVNSLLRANFDDSMIASKKIPTTDFYNRFSIYCCLVLFDIDMLYESF